MAEINGINLPFIPAGGVEQLKSRKLPFVENKTQSKFSDIFTEELNRLKFSAHANARIESRNISISGKDMARLESAFDQAQSKPPIIEVACGRIFGRHIHGSRQPACQRYQSTA